MTVQSLASRWKSAANGNQRFDAFCVWVRELNAQGAGIRRLVIEKSQSVTEESPLTFGVVSGGDELPVGVWDGLFATKTHIDLAQTVGHVIVEVSQMQANAILREDAYRSASSVRKGKS